ncbi:MAG: hypothetical protein AB7O24_20290 [Kofleriaceae bacterium]
MGRLENIIARNQRPPRRFHRLTVWIIVVMLAVVIVLSVFTDLATPPGEPAPTPRTSPGTDVRLDDVPLGGPRSPGSGSQAR